MAIAPIALPSSPAPSNFFSKTIIKELTPALSNCLDLADRASLTCVNRVFKSNMDYANSLVTSISLSKQCKFPYFRLALAQLPKLDRISLSSTTGFLEEVTGESRETLAAIGWQFRTRHLQHIDFVRYPCIHKEALTEFFQTVSLAPPQLLNVSNEETMSMQVPGIQLPATLKETLLDILSTRVNLSALRALNISTKDKYFLDPELFIQFIKVLPFKQLIQLRLAGHFFNKASWEFLATNLLCNQVVQELTLAVFDPTEAVPPADIGTLEVEALIESLTSPALRKLSIHVVQQLEIKAIQALIHEKKTSWPLLESALVHNFCLRTDKFQASDQLVYRPVRSENEKKAELEKLEFEKQNFPMLDYY